MFTFNDDGRKARRQSAGRHDMFRPDLLAQLLELEIIEIFEVARRHAHSTDAQPGLQIVDSVEIDQTLQRLAKRRGVVIALRLRTARRPKRRRGKTRREKAGNAERRDQGGTGLVEKGTPAIARREGIPRHWL